MEDETVTWSEAEGIEDLVNMSAYRFHFSISTQVLHFCSRLAPSSAAVTESMG